MLYDLSFLEPGAPWPPKSEAERMERYEQNLLLYETNNDEVYQQSYRGLREIVGESIEVVAGFPQTLSNHWGDMFVGEPPTYSVAGGETGSDDAAQTALNDLVTQTRLNTVLRQACIDYSRFGDALLKVRTKAGKARIEAVSPQVWFPVVSREDVTDVRAHVLAWVFDDGNDDPSKRRSFLHAEIHEPGRIERRVFEMAQGATTNIGRRLSESEAQEWFGDFEEAPVRTGSDSMLVFHVANDRTTNRLFGYDDYKVIDSYIQEVDALLTQFARLNYLHGFPVIAGPAHSASRGWLGYLG